MSIGPAVPGQRVFGEQHGQAIGLLPGRAAGRPDANPAARLRALGERRQGVGREQVERRAVAEEIGLVVEQRLDDLVGQARLAAHDEDRDQLVQGGDAALAQQRRQAPSRSASAGSWSVAGRCALRAGRRGCGWSCRLLARDAPRASDAIRRASLSGGMTAQARPASSTARGMPHTAQLASSWARTEPPQATSRAGAFDTVAAHAGQDDAERRPRRRARRPRRTSDPPTAGSRSTTGRGSAARQRTPHGMLDGQVGVAGRDDDPVGQQLHAVLGDQRLALGDRAELAREDAA